MLINDASITGSLIVNASASFQNISVGGNIIPDETNLRNLGSTDKFFKEIYVSTGSINFVDNGSVVAILSAGTINAIQSNTSSANDRLDAIQNTTSSVNTFTASISATNTFTSSTTTRLNSIETISASNIARLNALETTSASVDTLNTTQNSRLGSLETISASNIARISSLETTSASVDTLNITQNTRLTNLEIKTGSLATTGSNTFIGTQTITGSLYISSDLVVQGSSSLQNITASAVSIGTNIINLNTANPAIRYAGLVIGDSGSVGGSGSFLYDSVQDEMLFVHRGTSTVVTSSVTLMGPETYDDLGNETYLTNNRIPKGKGNEHLVDSNISDDGSKVTITGGLDITGAVSASTFTGLGNLTTYSASVVNRLLTFATTGSNTFVNTQNISLTTAGQATGLKLTNLNGGAGDAISIDFSVSGGGTTMSRLASNRTTVGSDLDVGLLFSTYSGSLTEKMRIQGNGFVGIGTTAPANKLEVFDTQTTIPQFQIKETSSAYHRFGILKSGSFVHFVEPGNDGTSASEYLMTINMNGNNVGIGTSSPGYPLDLYGVSSGTTSTLLRLKNGYNDPSTGIRARWDFASIAGAYLDVTTDSSGHKSMTLYLSSANATPSQVLTIAGSNGNLSSNGSVFAASDLYTANALRFNGSGLNASDKKLYSPTDGELQWMTHSSAGAHALSVSHQGTRYVYLDVSGNSYLNGGNVGIGITNPSNKLQVSGNIYSTDTVFGRNLKPEAFAGPAAGTPTSATIPPGYSSMTISSLCDNQWRPLMNNIGDVKAYFWVTLGDAASKDTANYFISMTSPAYGVSNFGNVSYQDNGWNTGGFEFTTDTSAGMYRLLVRCTSYYNSANTAYGTIYFLRME